MYDPSIRRVLLLLVASLGIFPALESSVSDPTTLVLWTLMVHFYQYIMVYGPADEMAALSLASIPTLIVFLAVQKVILRGIILPTYK